MIDVIGLSRREFIKEVAAGSAAAVAAARIGDVVGEAQTSDWKHRIGLELYTVRDQMARDYEGVLAKVARLATRRSSRRMGTPTCPRRSSGRCSIGSA